ncbi:hypothetical protein PV726_48290 [Streptomyces europaeiscabiei]|uniref:hypothetical protein n=1 Tax=Streptomyces europaeiscabiei TaxID=146819 RepID=UPI0029BC68C5|nr:hypothetical protein [Streptomyces europaeiscabiei]MDX3697832.1 hypothetical protein [Streptomyces europaeiscabiei]
MTSTTVYLPSRFCPGWPPLAFQSSKSAIEYAHNSVLIRARRISSGREGTSLSSRTGAADRAFGAGRP